MINRSSDGEIVENMVKGREGNRRDGEELGKGKGGKRREGGENGKGEGGETKKLWIKC